MKKVSELIVDANRWIPSHGRLEPRTRGEALRSVLLRAQAHAWDQGRDRARIELRRTIGAARGETCEEAKQAELLGITGAELEAALDLLRSEEVNH